MDHRLTGFVSATLVGMTLLAIPAARANDVKLPPAMSVTAYDTGTAGFNIAVGVARMMKDKYNADVRVLPAGNDVARLTPLRSKRAVMSAMGAGAYYAQEGVFEFGTREWGPQPLQSILSSVDCNAASLGVARDTGVKEMKDLRGKRVGHVVGAPALNRNALAMLAFGGLKEADVKIVEFASYGAMWKGILNNDVDAAFGTTITGPAKELETSSRGLVWPELPKKDAAGWERVKSTLPIFLPQVASCGAAIAKPIELANYPYPIFVSYGTESTEQVYAVAKAMITGYPHYKDAVPGAEGLAVDRQTKNWAIPVHPGAVKALKEARAWSDDQEAHNNGLLKRQAVLAAAWTDYGKSRPPSDEAAFGAGWLKARAAALAKAGMPNGFELEPFQPSPVAAAPAPKPQPQAAVPPPPPVVSTPPSVAPPPAAQAAQAAVAPTQAPAAIAPKGRRIALVIGNSKYKNVAALPNPQRDAAAVADALKRTGFAEVKLHTDLGVRALTEALQAFAKSARSADWAVVYYAGHGIEVGGVNYLVPIDATLESDRDITYEAVPLNQVITAVNGSSKLRLVMLDACRINPFAARMKREATASRAISRGFAREEPDAGTLVVYAAKDGEVASDGDGRNSPFTTALLQNMQKPGLEINRLFRLVRDDVLDATQKGQTPYTYGSLTGREEFYFIDPK